MVFLIGPTYTNYMFLKEHIETSGFIRIPNETIKKHSFGFLKGVWAAPRFNSSID